MEGGKKSVQGERCFSVNEIDLQMSLRREEENISQLICRAKISFLKKIEH